MLFRGRPAEELTRNIDARYWCVLAFGDDEGVVSDTVQSLLGTWGARGGIDVTLLDEDQVRKDPGVLFDALEAVSLLGDARCVRIRTSGDRIAGPLIEAIETAEKDPARFAARMIIEAGSLPAKSRLRNCAEKAQLTACLQMFEDDETGLGDRVSRLLGADNVSIDPDALDLFIADLPGHRAIANSEIEKLRLYGLGLGRPLNTEDVRSLCTTEVKQFVSSLVHACLDGKPGEAGRAYERLSENGTGGITVLRALQSEVMRMLQAHDLIAGGDRNPGRQLKPPVWQAEWTGFNARLGRWGTRPLLRALERIHDAERQAKTAGASSDAMVRVLINDLAKFKRTKG